MSIEKTMNPVSFIRKCITVLFGIGLSWFTLTNPDMQRIAECYVGGSTETSQTLTAQDSPTFLSPTVEQPTVAPSSTPESPRSPQINTNPKLPLVDPVRADFAAAPQLQPVSGASKPASSEDRISVISQQLRDLGATYLRLEKLTNDSKVAYRVRCDLGSEVAKVKCCFESTRESAVAAMEDVLFAVRENSQTAQVARSS